MQPLSFLHLAIFALLQLNSLPVPPLLFHPFPYHPFTYLLLSHSLPLLLLLSLFTDITAYPESVNVLEGVVSDVRTPDKLIDNINTSEDGSHSWLSPILPGVVNTIYIIFDTLHMIHGIKLWNYGKTPNRGTKEFAVRISKIIIIHTCAYVRTYIHTYIHTCTYVHTYIRTYVHTYIRTYIHIHTYIYVHTYIHTYIHAVHTYIHTYIHTLSTGSY